MPGPSRRSWITHRSALIAAALAGTLTATYPLLIGRSLVTPANGPTPLLYDQPPFVYGNGQPLWGQGQTFFLDPVHLLSLLIPDPAWAIDLRFIAGRAIFALGGAAAPGAGVAVLSESFVDRDFRATLNDRPVPYIRVNHGFKAVAIPGSGEWDVRFEYRPDLWGPAWAAAGLGLACVAALLVPSRLRSDAIQGNDRRR